MFYSNKNTIISNKNTYKELYFIVSFFYLALLLLSIIYYKERLCTDTAYYFYKTINEKSFHIEHQRYVQAFAEFPVLVAMQLNASLQICVLVYSISHVIFFASIAVLLARRYNNIFYALLILCLQLIGIVWGSLNPIIEHYYGTAILVAFYCILHNENKLNFPKYLLLFILSFLGLTSHPYNLILYIFILILVYLSKPQKKQLIAFILLIPIFLFYKKLNTSNYESEKIRWIFNLVENKHYLQLLTTAWWIQFCKILLIYYWHLLGILFFTIYFLLQNGKKIYAFILIVFFLNACIIINFSYDISKMSGYVEQVYFLLSPLVLLPFFFFVIPTIYNGFKKKIILTLFSMILTICISKQIILLNQFTKKTTIFTAWNNSAQTKTGCKFIIPASLLQPFDQFINWDMPFVTHILSAMQYEKQTTLAPAMDNNLLLIKKLNNTEYLFRNNEVGQLNNLNTNYLQLCADSNYYNW